MANSASLQLFDLINSMTRSEKRYFKIHIRTHSSKHSEEYIFLFDRIDAQLEYDEVCLIELMEKKGSDQRFAVLKHRLFEKVLDALESFQRSNDPVMTLRHDLNKVKVLLDRGMDRIALVSLKKILDKALEVEAHQIALEAIALIEFKVGIESDLLQGEPSYKDLLEKNETEHSVTTVRHELLKNLESAGRVRTGLTLNTSMVEEYLLQCLEDNDAPARSRYLAHHSISAMYFSRNDIKSSLEHISACERILSENKHLRKEFPLALAEMWANECYIKSRQDDMSSSKECITSLLQVELEELKFHLQKDFRGILIQSLLFYMSCTEDAEMESRLLEEEEFYNQHRWDYPATVRGAIDYGLGLYYHSKGMRGDALKFLNKVLNDGDIKRDEDVYHRTLVLVTVLHAESGDREWMAHSARALKRYLKPRDLMRGVEGLLLDYISDFRRARSEEGEERAMRQFVHRLRTIRRQPIERVSFEHFDFLSWAEAQIGEDRPEGLVA